MSRWREEQDICSEKGKTLEKAEAQRKKQALRELPVGMDK